jgi:hypothetical protein
MSPIRARLDNVWLIYYLFESLHGLIEQPVEDGSDWEGAKVYVSPICGVRI